jgi:hypothetical protein
MAGQKAFFAAGSCKQFSVLLFPSYSTVEDFCAFYDVPAHVQPV